MQRPSFKPFLQVFPDYKFKVTPALHKYINTCEFVNLSGQLAKFSGSQSDAAADSSRLGREIVSLAV
jgi:hypothetical protein